MQREKHKRKIFLALCDLLTKSQYLYINQFNLHFE
jgi:hypothetical protein